MSVGTCDGKRKGSWVLWKPLKKTGRLLMIEVELDKQVQEYIRYFRESGIGAVVNTELVIATGKGY